MQKTVKNAQDGDYRLLKIINESSVSSEHILNWCNASFPTRTIKLLTVDEAVVSQDSSLIVFYDSLERHIDRVEFNKLEDLDTVLSSWCQLVEKIEELVAGNPQKRMGVDVDSISHASGTLQALNGSMVTGIELRDLEPISDITHALTKLLLLQVPRLQDKSVVLTTIGTSCQPMPVSVENIYNIIMDLNTLRSNVRNLEHAVNQRDNWLEKLRSAVWDANMRAQQAEARARDLAARFQEQIQVNNDILRECDTALVANKEEIATPPTDTYVEELEFLQKEVNALRNSTSWKITAPMRWVKMRLQALRH